MNKLRQAIKKVVKQASKKQLVLMNNYWYYQ